MSEILTEFAVQIIIFVILGVGGSVSAYFFSLKRSLHRHKKETDKKIQVLDDRSIRFAKAFIHYVKRSDELHSNREDSPDQKLAGEVDNILRDKDGNL